MRKISTCSICKSALHPTAHYCPNGCTPPPAKKNKAKPTQDTCIKDSPPSKNGPLKILAKSLFVIIGVLFLISQFTDNPEIDARVMAQKFVKSHLVSPASAKFPWTPSETTVTESAGIYTVVGYVDSKNRMGTPLRSHYTVKMNPLANDKWRLIDLKIK